MSWTEALIALSLKVRHLIAGDIVILFSSVGGEIESRFSLYSIFFRCILYRLRCSRPTARLNDTLYAQGCTDIGEPTRAF